MKRRNEGFIDIPKAGKVWYEIVGNHTNIPLVVLHGGPGYPHDSLEPLEDLTDERNVIYYDQLGCGNSQKVKDKSLWTTEYFVHELQEVIKKLNLKQYHIIGQSWGAGLAVAFALTKTKGLRSLILADPYISTPHWEKDAKRLLKQLPKTMQTALRKGDIQSKAYKAATNEFYNQFVFRMKQRPVGSIKAQNKMSNEIYNYMWGPEEFNVKGTLKKLDLSSKLKEIKIPTLFICGRFDEATPESTEYFRSLTPNAKIKIFEKSAHMPHWTERKEYVKTIKNFLQGVE